MHRSHLEILIALIAIFLTAPSYAAEEDHPVEDAAKFKLRTKADPSLPTLLFSSATPP